MKFAVIGGDRRSAWLCALLEGDGHRVYTYALEKAELPKEVPKAGCLQGCVYGADWIILPTPAERGGVLNAPYSSEQLRLEEIISALWPGQVLCGGKLSQSAAVGAVRAGLQVQNQSEILTRHTACPAGSARYRLKLKTRLSIIRFQTATPL